MDIFQTLSDAGRDPHNKELHDLIGDLGTRSEEFRSRWGAHNVRHHGAGFKTFIHPIVGEMTLAFVGLEMAAEPGLTLTNYTAEPGSPSAERMQLLASWAASDPPDAGMDQPAGKPYRRAESPGWNCLHILHDLARIDRHRAPHELAMWPEKVKGSFRRDAIHDLKVNQGPVIDDGTVVTFTKTGPEELNPRMFEPSRESCRLFVGGGVG